MFHPRIICYEHVIANVATQIHRINSTERAMFVLFPEHLSSQLRSTSFPELASRFVSLRPSCVLNPVRFPKGTIKRLLRSSYHFAVRRLC